MRAKYHDFKGDAGLPYEAVWRSHPGWYAIAIYAYYFARWCGLHPSSETQERWMRIWALAYRLDELLDEHPPGQEAEARRCYQELLEAQDPLACEFPEWVHPDLPPLMALCNNALRELGQDARDELVDMALSVADLAPVKARKRSVFMYGRVLGRESRLTASLAGLCATAEERSDQQAYGRFVRAFGHITAAGVIMDHWYDLRTDFTHRRSRVRPCKSNRRVLLAWCMLQAVKLAASDPRVGRHLRPKLRLLPRPRLVLPRPIFGAEPYMTAERKKVLSLTDRSIPSEKRKRHVPTTNGSPVQTATPAPDA